MFCLFFCIQSLKLVNILSYNNLTHILILFINVWLFFYIGTSTSTKTGNFLSYNNLSHTLILFISSKIIVFTIIKNVWIIFSGETTEQRTGKYFRLW